MNLIGPGYILLTEIDDQMIGGGQEHPSNPNHRSRLQANCLRAAALRWGSINIGFPFCVIQHVSRSVPTISRDRAGHRLSLSHSTSVLLPCTHSTRNISIRMPSSSRAGSINFQRFFFSFIPDAAATGLTLLRLFSILTSSLVNTARRISSTHDLVYAVIRTETQERHRG